MMKFKESFNTSISKSSWICARSTDTDILLTSKELEQYRSPKVHLFQDPNRLLYVHHSYLFLCEWQKKLVEEWLNIIKAFKKLARGNSSNKYLNKFLDAANETKEILNKKSK